MLQANHKKELPMQVGEIEKLSWKWQMKNSRKELTGVPKELTEKYPFFIPPFFYDHIKSLNYPSSLTNQFFPKQEELADNGLVDPIGDKAFKQVDKLIHRYENRVLLTPTTVCPIQCRYCFRKNELHHSDLLKGDIDQALGYIATNKQINEVILTGGDPLILDSKILNRLLVKLSEMEHIQWIRLHTRTPIILPMRIDEDFLSLMSEKIKLVIHINHVDEITDLFRVKIKELLKTGVELLSQTVLLKEVNDCPKALENLFQTLAQMRIRAYYLHHPDKVRGGMHFWLEVSEGRKIFSKLRNKLSGWMLPEYILDIPGGHGKTPIWNPETFEFSGRLIDQHGMIQSYQLCDQSTQ